MCYTSPSPCKHRDPLNLDMLQPEDWRCPPTIKKSAGELDHLCFWTRNGNLKCPKGCTFTLVSFNIRIQYTILINT